MSQHRAPAAADTLYEAMTWGLRTMDLVDHVVSAPASYLPELSDASMQERIRRLTGPMDAPTRKVFMGYGSPLRIEVIPKNMPERNLLSSSGNLVCDTQHFEHNRFNLLQPTDFAITIASNPSAVTAPTQPCGANATNENTDVDSGRWPRGQLLGGRSSANRKFGYSVVPKNIPAVAAHHNTDNASRKPVHNTASTLLNWRNTRAATTVSQIASDAGGAVRLGEYKDVHNYSSTPSVNRPIRDDLSQPYGHNSGESSESQYCGFGFGTPPSSDHSSQGCNVPPRSHHNRQLTPRSSKPYHKQIDGLPEAENCALFITNVPASVKYHEMFDLIDCGAVFTLHIYPADADHVTAAAKLVFMKPGSARYFQLRSQIQGYFLGTSRLHVDFNRHGCWSYPGDQTRILQIEGPAEIMTETYWRTYFEKECRLFEWERVKDLPCEKDGQKKMEFRFIRVDGQARMCYKVLKHDPYHRNVEVAYGRDPCEP